MLNKLRWAAGGLTDSAAISFSLLVFYDSHIRELESSLDKRRDLHSRLTASAQRAVDEFNSAFSTRDHVQILERLGEDEATVNLVRRNIMGSIRHAILMIRANTDIFKKSQTENEEMLGRYSTPDELTSVFQNDLLYMRDYLNRMAEEHTTAMSDISTHKSWQSTMYLLTVVFNSLGLGAGLFLGPVEKRSTNPPRPPVQTTQRERRRR